MIGTDTRAELLAAARKAFSEHGYRGTTIRMIAGQVGVDIALISYYFGSKEELFVNAVLEPKIRFDETLLNLSGGCVDTLGERIVRAFLTTWDSTGGSSFTSLMFSVSSHEPATRVLRDFLVEAVFTRLASRMPDHTRLRATLVASCLIGLGFGRYVLKVEPLASATVETVITAVAPGVQRYLADNLT